MRTALPAPAPGSIRRTLSLEVAPDPDWSAGLRVSAFGRDLLAGTEPGRSRVIGTAAVTATIDTASRVTGIALTGLPPALTAPLIGAAATHGFRARLTSLAGLDPWSLESAILDELPTVRLISGYARMIELPPGAAMPQAHGRQAPMVGVCAGWAPGATADRRFLAGAPLVTATPPAPSIASMTPYFHAEPAPAPRSMRRRRVLDVARRPAGYEVFEYFRDSHLDAELREGALHEYEVHARAAADAGCTLEHIDVVPHALPFGECPLAAPNAADLAGASLRDVSATVKQRLAGTRSCTHLNDTLRFLRYVPALAELGKNEEDR